VAERFNDREWKAHNAHALHRDGDLCLACLAELNDDPGPLLAPTLDHLDGDKKNNRPANIIRLCRRHNTAEGNRCRPAIRAWKKAKPAARAALAPIWACRLVNPETYPSLRALAAEILLARPSALNEPDSLRLRGKGRGERETAQPNPLARWTIERPEDDGDAERARIQQERMNPEYRLWLFEQVKEHGSITKADAILSGAEIVDRLTGKGAKKTILDYFDKITSRAGWLEETRSIGGRLVWTFRRGLNQGELEAELRSRVNTLRDLLKGYGT
jgi:hypothetical protein